MLYSVLDIDNLVYMRLDDGTKAQPELVSKDLVYTIHQLEDIKKKCFGKYKLVEVLVQQDCCNTIGN